MLLSQSVEVHSSTGLESIRIRRFRFESFRFLGRFYMPLQWVNIASNPWTGFGLGSEAWFEFEVEFLSRS